MGCPRCNAQSSFWPKVCGYLIRAGGRPPRLNARNLGRAPPKRGSSASQAMGEGALRSFYRRTAALGDARPILSTCAGLSWPSSIDWQRWVGRDLKVRAVVVAVISIPIESVFTHPKDDLQRAFLAVDVGEANVGLMK